MNKIWLIGRNDGSTDFTFVPLHASTSEAEARTIAAIATKIFPYEGTVEVRPMALGLVGPLTDTPPNDAALAELRVKLGLDEPIDREAEHASALLMAEEFNEGQKP